MHLTFKFTWLFSVNPPTGFIEQKQSLFVKQWHDQIQSFVENVNTRRLIFHFQKQRRRQRQRNLGFGNLTLLGSLKAPQQSQITKSKILWRTWAHDGKFFYSIC